MSNCLIIRNATLVNEGRELVADIRIREGRIDRIGSIPDSQASCREIDATGLLLIPGVIDDQVHFREPGLTHKADIRTESRAAAAGGITSYMEMPNTIPQTLTQSLLEEKYQIAAASSAVNYSFFMGASNHNVEEVLQTDTAKVCGVKIFMGSSTGDMLVDNERTLENIFSRVETLIATHCEYEPLIRKLSEEARQKFGEEVPIEEHPFIRSREACYQSSSLAIALAKKYNTRLHILHISTAEETHLFSNSLPLTQKRITAEACVHHLWFSDSDYSRLGSLIKWNPAIKSGADRQAVRDALLDDRIDIVATDHAPHTLAEKAETYFKCPSGGPLAQHALPAMLEFVHEGWLSTTKLVEKMCHAPADCFRIKDRGYIREGYFADLVLIDMSASQKVEKKNILYKCAWSPFEGVSFKSSVHSTFVNGRCVYENGKVNDDVRGSRLLFSRER